MKLSPTIWRLIRLCLRRDRWTLPATISLVWLMVVGSASALITTYGDQESIASYAAAAAASAIGRIFQGAIQDASIGSILVAEVFLTGAVILGIISIFTVSRHSRHNEETGAAELICARAARKSDLLTVGPNNRHRSQPAYRTSYLYRPDSDGQIQYRWCGLFRRCSVCVRYPNGRRSSTNRPNSALIAAVPT